MALYGLGIGDLATGVVEIESWFWTQRAESALIHARYMNRCTKGRLYSVFEFVGW